MLYELNNLWVLSEFIYENRQVLWKEVQEKGRKGYESIGFSEFVEIQPWIVYNGCRKMTEESWDTGDEP